MVTGKCNTRREEGRKKKGEIDARQVGKPSREKRKEKTDRVTLIIYLRGVRKQVGQERRWGRALGGGQENKG